MKAKKAKERTFYPFLDDINTVDELNDLIEQCQKKKEDIFQKERIEAMEKATALIEELNTLLKKYNFEICGSDNYLDCYAIIEEIEDIREGRF